jgi:anti-sigma B factor antagonist
MNSSATTRHSGKVVVIDVVGRISIEDGLGVMGAAIREMLAAGHKHILLNLEAVTYMDSAGLGEMASAYITATSMGGKLKLVNVRERVGSMLHVTRLYKLLIAYPNESLAVASFGLSADS